MSSGWFLGYLVLICLTSLADLGARLPSRID